MRAIPTGGFTYLQFITPGILTQSVVFVAIFYGLYIIMDRDTGILQKLLVTPTPRLALVWGKMLSAGLRGLCQALIVFIFALILGVSLHLIVLTYPRCDRHRPARRGGIYRHLDDHCFYCKDARAVYGHRAGRHASALLRLERDLSDRDHARLAPGGGEHQSAELYGGRTAVAHAHGTTAGVGLDILILAVVALGISVISAWMYPKVVI